MTDQMTRWERVRAALKGEEVDRTPVSVWRHFFNQENTVQGLADAMLGFQAQHSWDFMKVNPRASFHAEDWGLKMRFSDSNTRAPELVDWPVKATADWDAVQPLDVSSGVLGQQLDSLRLIASGLGGQTPFVMTLFTPLSIVGRLTGSDEAMLGQMKENPEKVHQALEVITETFINFSRESLNIGASGMFYATTSWGTYDLLTDEEYNEFGRPYDLKLLAALPEAEFHILHVCRSNNMLKTLADYPVAAFNWDTQDPTNMWLKEGGEATGKPVIGGISHRSILHSGSPGAVADEATGAVAAMDNTRWMLGSGCTMPPDVPSENLQALKSAIMG